MLKLLSSLSIAGLMFFGWISADGVVIEDDTPNQLNSGERTLVTVQINKGQVSGFAKLQLELPSGLSAEAVDTKGASFTFKDQKAKFIWMVLPENQEFSVSYYLEAGANASGDKIITGSFSYIRDNSRVDYPLNSKTVSTGSNDVAATDNSDSSSGGATEGGESNSASSGTGLNITRDITKISDSEFIVNVKVKNASLDGFAKVMENYPEGFKAEEETTSGATVTMEPRGIKYVWFSPPTSNEFEVSYKLTKTDDSAQDPTISGSFAYIKDNNPFEVAINDGGFDDQLADNSDTDQNQGTEVDTEEPSTDNSIDETDELTAEIPDVSIDEEETADTGDTKSTDVEEVIDPVQVIDEEEEIADNKLIESTDNSTTQDNSGNVNTDTAQGSDTGTENTDTGSNNTTDNTIATTQPEEEEIAQNTKKITSIPDPETGVSYRVQIAAGPNTVGKIYFRQKHNYTEDFNIENHNGYVKYTTGGHDMYKLARNDRERIRSSYNFNGPFVTAYNDGERITVQEALMITQQKWYQ